MAVPPRSRWFQFGLRTMFVVVTVLAVWLGWELRVVRERKAFLSRATSFSDGNRTPPLEIPRYRYWLGDKRVGMIHVESDDDRRQAERLFPEAWVFPPLGPEFKLHREIAPK